MLVVALFLSSFLIHPKITELNSISQKNLDERIFAEGTVERVYENPGVTYIKMKNSNVSLVLFYPLKQKLRENSSIEIIGKISQYQGKLQVNAEKIICLKC